MTLPDRVKLVEVGPRDGLQNEAKIVPTSIKVEFINRLSQCGFPTIEVGSFVSPTWIPQMADTQNVLQAIERKPGVHYPVLAPNIEGFENALTSGAEEIVIFVAASETFSQKNINCSIEESFERYIAVSKAASARNIPMRGYVSCVLGCPYEGEIDPEKVAELSKRLYELGCYELSLGDTIGVGTPAKAQALYQKVADVIPRENIAAHFHDTYGQGLANIFAVLECGITTFDCSVSGLGGCPYAHKATGNVATEDVLYMLNGLGIETGVDLNLLMDVGLFICEFLEKPSGAKVTQACR